jgi:hypothetical protein
MERTERIKSDYQGVRGVVATQQAAKGFKSNNMPKAVIPLPINAFYSKIAHEHL